MSVRRGMTLIELMAGLAIGGLLLVGGRALIAELQDVGVTLGRSARANDARANARRTVYALVRRADVRPDSTSRFAGDSLSASFRTLCDRPGGWLARCDLSLRVVARRDSSSLEGQASTGEVLTLDQWRGGASLRYLDVSGGQDQWVSQWGSSIVPPAAIAVVVDADTIVLPVAGR